MYQKPEDWHSLFQAVSIEIPASLQRFMAGDTQASADFEQAASRAHHACLNLAGAMINSLYVRTGFWDFVPDNSNGAARMQRLAQAGARVFLASFGPWLGIAPVAEVDALQDELIRLRRELNGLYRKLETQTGAGGGLRRIK